MSGFAWSMRRFTSAAASLDQIAPNRRRDQTQAIRLPGFWGKNFDVMTTVGEQLRLVCHDAVLTGCGAGTVLRVEDENPHVGIDRFP